jgi:hypothetical protein
MRGLEQERLPSFDFFCNFPYENVLGLNICCIFVRMSPASRGQCG